MTGISYPIGHLFARREQVLDHPPDLAAAFEVETVYPGSPAAAAGVKPGWCLLVPGTPFNVFDAAELGVIGALERLEVLYWDPQRATVVSLDCQGFPHGVSLVPTIPRLAEQYGDFNEISRYVTERALEADDETFATLAQIARRAHASSHPLDALNRFGIRALVSIYARDSRQFIYVPARIVDAAWIAESGKHAKARKILPPEDLGRIFDEGRQTVAMYYYAIAMIEAATDRSYAIQLLEHAEKILGHPAARITEKRAQLVALHKAERDTAGTRDDTSQGFEADHEDDDDANAEAEDRESTDQSAAMAPLDDCVIPSNFDVFRHDPTHGPLPRTASPISCLRTLERLAPDQFLLLVVLGAYRANGYYDPMMGYLAKLYPTVAARFPRVWVVTSYDPEIFDNQYGPWLDGETYARDRGVPIELLFDPHDLASQIFATERSPHVAVVNRAGDVVANGMPSIEQSIWYALHSAPGAKGSTSELTVTGGET
ncbi:MAG: hypothetical protein AAFQ42_10775 [Pseudomonadota bacterium]